MNYWYNDGDGIEPCESAEKAQNAARLALIAMGDQSADGWPQEVDAVAWGRYVDGVAITVEQAVMIDRVEMCHDDDCDCGKTHPDDDFYVSSFDYTCDYVLKENADNRKG